MPGVTIVAGGTAALETCALAHLENYTTDVCVALPGLVVAVTRYPGYPIARFDDARFTIVLEGCVYDAAPGELERELPALARAMFDVSGGSSASPEPRGSHRVRPVSGGSVASPEPRGSHRVHPFGMAADAAAVASVAAFAGRDGEFVAVLVDRAAGTAVVVTDRHGRLPLYRRRAGAVEIVSRDLSFVARHGAAAALRPAGIAEFLTFGYPLGDGTLFEGVTRVAPASVLRLPDGPTARSHGPYDFSDEDGAADAESTAADIAVALVQACRVRATGHRPVLVSLSGGIDSRMVAGALSTAGVEARAVTHGSLDGGASRDVAIAERVAAGLGMPWELLPVAAPTGADVERLLALKAGANYLGMTPVVPVLEALRRRYGAGAVLFTGDLGDRLLGDRTPAAQPRDVRDLATYLLRREAILAPEVVEAITGHPAAQLLDAVVGRLESYPERRLAQKHVHFLFAERAYRWVYEGEDRNRCFLWHTTPFYAPAVFARASRVPTRIKRDERLRARVLALVAPEVADLPNASTGAPPDASSAAWRGRARRLAASVVYRTLGPDTERRLRRWLHRLPPRSTPSELLDVIRAQLRGTGPVASYLRPGAVERLLDDAPAYPREQFSVVLTVTSLIDGMGDRPVLRAYHDTEL